MPVFGDFSLVGGGQLGPASTGNTFANSTAAYANAAVFALSLAALQQRLAALKG